MSLPLYTTVKNHLLPVGDYDKLSRLIALHEGKDIKITIARGRARSTPQNKYYWGVVIPMVWQGLVDLGNDCDDEDVHEYLKERFGKRKVMQNYTIAESTTKMSTVEFEEYLERIKRFAAVDLCVNIPDPEDA